MSDSQNISLCLNFHLFVEVSKERKNCKAHNTHSFSLSQTHTHTSHTRTYTHKHTHTHTYTHSHTHTHTHTPCAFISLEKVLQSRCRRPPSLYGLHTNQGKKFWIVKGEKRQQTTRGHHTGGWQT